MNKWDARIEQIEQENAILKKHLEKVCTEIDFLIAEIQMSTVDREAYTPRLDIVWIDAFYQELPIGRYSKAEE